MFKDKLKNLLPKKEGDDSNKRKLENIVVFLIILIITIIVINVILNNGKEENNEQVTDPNKRLASSQENLLDTNSYSQGNESEFANNLEEILSQISGVGKVKVLVTYSETSKTVPVYNEESTEENTEETDSEGGTRKITQTDTKKEAIYEENDGNKTLITQSIVSPTIEGAIVTAEGANNAQVKTNIVQAVEAVTGLATHKIQVFEMAN